VNDKVNRRKDAVRDFWNRNVCQVSFIKTPEIGSVPIARTYSRDGARELFAQFSEVHVDVDYLFGTGWGVVNRLMPASLHRFLGRHIGWHLMIRAVK
jgi:hypothetical protein